VRLLLVVYLALALVPTASARTPGPCSLLTDHEVSTALGRQVANQTSYPGLAPSCLWTGMPLTNQYGQSSLNLTVSQEPEKMFVKFEHRSGGQAVKGVGNTAVWVPKIHQLSAWYRGYSINITIFGPYVTSPLLAAKTLTNAALVRA